VFVYDRQHDHMVRASVSAEGTQQYPEFWTQNQMSPKLSMDGRYVAFTSIDSNLVGGDTNGVIDVFVVDWQRLPPQSPPHISTIAGQLTSDGITAPNPRLAMNLQVTIKLYYGGGAGEWVLPVTSDEYGRFQVGGLGPDTYELHIKGSNTLSVTKVVTLADGENALNVALPPAGDVDGNNVINLADFSILATTFGKQSGNAGFDARADFNGDGVVNLIDFSLLAANFGQSGT
jgi:hypothetical protein